MAGQLYSTGTSKSMLTRFREYEVKQEGNGPLDSRAKVMIPDNKYG